MHREERPSERGDTERRETHREERHGERGDALRGEIRREEGVM